MDEKYAQFLLKKISQDYNIISEHFSKTRTFLWPELNYLAQFCLDGEKILDIGCGNGRLLDLFCGMKIEYFGIDSSEKLIEIAKKRYLKSPSSKNEFLPKINFQLANALNLPFPENYFDKVFSIATFHHIPSEKLRLKFLKEAKKVLKKGGLLILTVWNLYQRKFLRYHLKQLIFKITGLSKLDFGDIFYPWRSFDGKIIIQRYFHCFRKSGLENLVKKSDFKIKEIGFLGKKRQNIYLIAEKYS